MNESGRLWEELAAFIPLDGLALTILIGGIVLSSSRWPASWREKIARKGQGLVARMPEQRWQLYAIVLSLAAVLLVGMTLARYPEPYVHDEFAYFIGAETFASGRLTNPTPAMWEFFEAPHVLYKPTFMMKYPVAPALLMAFGIITTGHAIVGVWLGSLAGIAAVFWMLEGFLPRRWAFLGALVTVLHPLTLFWGYTYYTAGGLSMLGGALVLGAARRLGWRSGANTFRYGWLLGIGLGLLALTRPFEGALFGLGCILYLMARFLRQRAGRNRITALLAAGIPLLAVVAGIGIYNRAVTGSATTLPYAEFTKQYDPVPLFIWQKVREVRFRHVFLERSYNWTLGWWVSLKESPTKLLRNRIRSVPTVFRFALWSLPLGVGIAIGVVSAIRRRRIPGEAVLLFGFGLATLACVYIQPHYAACGVGLMTLLGVAGLRRFSLSAPEGMRRFRTTVVTAGTLTVSLAITLISLALMFHKPDGPKPDGPPGVFARRAMERELVADGKRHLVVVRYKPKNHLGYFLWHYNGANIDRQPVVWAVDMGREKNRALLDYYKDRVVHLLTVVTGDEGRPQLEPYPKEVN